MWHVTSHHCITRENKMVIKIFFRFEKFLHLPSKEACFMSNGLYVEHNVPFLTMLLLLVLLSLFLLLICFCWFSCSCSSCRFAVFPATWFCQIVCILRLFLAVDFFEVISNNLQFQICLKWFCVTFQVIWHLSWTCLVTEGRFRDLCEQTKTQAVVWHVIASAFRFKCWIASHLAPTHG